MSISYRVSCAKNKNFKLMLDLHVYGPAENCFPVNRNLNLLFKIHKGTLSNYFAYI